MRNILLIMICVCVTRTIGANARCLDRVNIRDFSKYQDQENKNKLDPFTDYEKIIADFLYGSKVSEGVNNDNVQLSSDTIDGPKMAMRSKLHQYPSGNFMRAELFRNVTGVHKPLLDYMVPGHYRLKITKDHMQTALNALSIFVDGDMKDVLRLPYEYVLNSARTISMLKIAQEKLAATWTVIKNNKTNMEISHTTLEAYRPLFKYVNGREIARLNLSDSRILKFIGSHPDLSRHQVGVIASTYIKVNPDWTSPRYLNQMNNLLCGVPMLHMRKLQPNTFLQLSHQVFYHIKACDPIQRRFYLKMMTKTQVLGRAFSWSARDVARLGLLLAELSESELTAIKPQAMSGLTPQVMLEIPAKNLKYISEAQIQYMDQRSLNIMAKKLKEYNDAMGNNHTKQCLSNFLLSLFLLILFILK